MRGHDEQSVWEVIDIPMKSFSPNCILYIYISIYVFCDIYIYRCGHGVSWVSHHITTLKMLELCLVSHTGAAAATREWMDSTFGCLGSTELGSAMPILARCRASTSLVPSPLMTVATYRTGECAQGRENEKERRVHQRQKIILFISISLAQRTRMTSWAKATSAPFRWASLA